MRDRARTSPCKLTTLFFIAILAEKKYKGGISRAQATHGRWVGGKSMANQTSERNSFAGGERVTKSGLYTWYTMDRQQTRTSVYSVCFNEKKINPTEERERGAGSLDFIALVCVLIALMRAKHARATRHGLEWWFVSSVCAGRASVPWVLAFCRNKRLNSRTREAFPTLSLPLPNLHSLSFSLEAILFFHVSTTQNKQNKTPPPP